MKTQLFKPSFHALKHLLWAGMLLMASLAVHAAVVFTNLHSFMVFPQGANPVAPLVRGGDGYFYGTTQNGGTNGGHGTAFRVSTNGELTSVYSFTDPLNFANPYIALVKGSDGEFYGVTPQSGTYGWGSVFRISTSGTLTTLYSFTNGQDGAGPVAGLVQGSDGDFYGTTSGSYGTTYGTAFKISTNCFLTTLHSFTGGNDGDRSSAALVEGSDGYFYGRTHSGGTNGYGTVFKISANGAFSTLCSFADGPYDAPPARLLQGSDGYLYGTTAASPTLPGSVFRISTNGVLTTLHTFTGGSEGWSPVAGLVQGSDGYLYGITEFGGDAGGSGTVFRIGTDGTLTTLYAFTGGNDGAIPVAELVQGSDGTFYGTTEYGGTDDTGTIFKMDTNGTLTTLYSFPGAHDHQRPYGSLVQGSDGYFYGTTSEEDDYAGPLDPGSVFKIGTNGALTTLYSFTGSDYSDSGGAGYPVAGLVQGRDGYFYGTTEGGSGTNVYGTVFKISTNGVLTILYSFIGGDDGSSPEAGLVQGSDGNFYGTTSASGMNNP